MPPTDTVEVVRALLEDVHGDAERMLALMDPDCEWEIVATGEKRRGHEGMRAMLSSTRSIFTEHHLRVDNAFASGDWACAEYTNSATFTGAIDRPDLPLIEPTGKRHHVKICLVARLHDGKVATVREYHDMATMLRQLGVDPHHTTR